MDKFIELMAEVYDLEPEDIKAEDKIREIEGFSSLTGFSIIVTLEDEYDVKMTVDEFLACETIQDLYDKVTA